MYLLKYLVYTSADQVPHFPECFSTTCKTFCSQHLCRATCHNDKVVTERERVSENSWWVAVKSKSHSKKVKVIMFLQWWAGSLQFVYLQKKCTDAIDTETTVKLCVCVCVSVWWKWFCNERQNLRSRSCVFVTKGCAYIRWQAVFYGKSDLGDFMASPDQLNDLWASLIRLVSSTQSQVCPPVCYISVTY